MEYALALPSANKQTRAYPRSSNRDTAADKHADSSQPLEAPLFVAGLNIRAPVSDTARIAPLIFTPLRRPATACWDALAGCPESALIGAMWKTRESSDTVPAKWTP
jgi:hypothetical protein